jgi:hypothetical protein
VWKYFVLLAGSLLFDVKSPVLHKPSSQPFWETLRLNQRVTKRCRLSLLTNSALVYESQCEGDGGGMVAGSQPMSTAAHIT